MSNYDRRGFELSNGDTGYVGGETINGTGQCQIGWFQDDPEELREPALLSVMSFEDMRKLAALLNEAADTAERATVTANEPDKRLLGKLDGREGEQ